MLIFSSGFCLHLYLLLSYFFRICEREDLVPKDQKVWVSSFDNNSIFFFVEALILRFLLFQVQFKEAEWLHCLSEHSYTIYLINWPKEPLHSHKICMTWMACFPFNWFIWLLSGHFCHMHVSMHVIFHNKVWKKHWGKVWKLE